MGGRGGGDWLCMEGWGVGGKIDDHLSVFICSVEEEVVVVVVGFNVVVAVFDGSSLISDIVLTRNKGLESK